MSMSRDSRSGNALSRRECGESRRAPSLLVKKGSQRPRSALFRSSDLPLREGILQKLNRHGRWQRRWFFIQETSPYLTYSKRKGQQEVPALEKTIRGTIDLRSVDSVCIVLRFGRPSRKFAVRVAGPDFAEESLVLRAPSVISAIDWVEFLNARRDAYLTIPTPDPQNSAKPPEPPVKSVPPPLERMYTAHEIVHGDEQGSGDDDNVVDDSDWWSVPEEEDYGDDLDEEDDSELFDGTVDVKPVQAPISEVRCSGACTAFDSPSVARIPLLRKEVVSDPGVTELRVRGRTYTTDRLKTKSRQTLFEFCGVDLTRNVSGERGRVDHIASHPQNRVAIVNKEAVVPLPFLLILNFQVPGTNGSYMWTAYYKATTECTREILRSGVVNLCSGDTENTSQCAANTDGNINSLRDGQCKLVRDFLLGDDDELRNERFKLVPRIVEGPWIVRSAVGSKPALIGKKLTQRYFRRNPYGPDAKLVNGHPYLEVCIDIGSSSIANRITGMSLGFGAVLVVDCATVIEGRQEEELPELPLGIFRARHPEFSTDAVDFDFAAVDSTVDVVTP